MRRASEPAEKNQSQPAEGKELGKTSRPQPGSKRAPRKGRKPNINGMGQPLHLRGELDEFRSTAPLYLEREIYDTLFLFAQPGTTISSVGDALGISKKIVVRRLKQAFLSGSVLLPVADTSTQSPLKRLFPDVCIRIVQAKNLFPVLASHQVLTWLKECLEPIPPLDPFPLLDAAGFDEKSRQEVDYWCPYVAIGGGESMQAMVDCIPQVLDSPIGRDSREWLDRDRYRVVNATAGGQPLNPVLESSQIATRLAQVTRQKCGLYNVPRSKAIVDENRLIKMAVRNTTVIVSGIGDKKRAYCVEAMRKMDIWKPEFEQKIVGEFLFQTFDAQCKPYPRSIDRQIDTKEFLVTEPEYFPQEPMLARLLKFESLKGRPAVNKFLTSENGVELPRWVIGVADCKRGKEENKDAKARAILTLLQNGYLSHLCVSADLADAIVFQAFEERRGSRDRTEN